jgi:hypothetical protein
MALTERIQVSAMSKDPILAALRFWDRLSEERSAE